MSEQAIPEQIEAHVRSVQRKCRGPRSQVAGAAVLRLLNRQVTPSDVLAMSLIFKLDLSWLTALIEDDKLRRDTTNHIRFQTISAGDLLALFDEPTQARICAELMADLDATARVIDQAGRKPCGADVNDLILSQPLDGEEHAANCPRCGQLLTWTAPKFEQSEGTNGSDA